jgi:hypothetical protein
MPSWDEFRQSTQRDIDEQRAELDDWVKLNARLFSSADGQRWLAQVRQDKFGRSLSPAIPEAELRHLEGQRQMIRDIDTLVAKGMDALKKASG